MPGGFVSLRLDVDYRTDKVRIGRDLVARLLDGALSYDRAVGFFSSSSVRVLAPELAAFFAAGGVMRIVCSPRVESNDFNAIVRAIFDRQHSRTLWESIDDAFRSQRWPSVLSFLIATGRLKMRIAIPDPVSYGRRMYHEKIGIVSDAEGNIVAFSGSANESATGLSENFERVDVFASWLSDVDRRRAQRISEQFRALWKNRTVGLSVMDLPEAFQRKVWTINNEEFGDAAMASTDDLMSSISVPPEILISPTDLLLRPHQEQAIRAWGDNGGRGILEMATGSGKTLTALSLAAKVYERLSGGFVLLIVAPFVHLVDQWCDVAITFGLRPIRCAESSDLWASELQAAIHAVNSGGRPVVSIVTTGATLTSSRFQDAVRRIRVPALIVADEVHNYGTTLALQSLPPNIGLRIGLSATPERWRDEKGTAGLEEYFGNVIFRYSLKDAIDDEVLTAYRYFPLAAPLDSNELEAYFELTVTLAKYIHGRDETQFSEGAKSLLIKRARVLAGAKSKLTLLRKVLESKTHQTHILIYCGDGSVTGPVDATVTRQVEEVVRVVGAELKMRVAPYLSETSANDRRRLISAFEAGDIQALVAIRCLDEGVDVPAARTGLILASSTNPRQFVQRRGRLLRRAPGKNSADIYDFFAVPDLGTLAKGSAEWKMARGVLGSQIPRAREFAELARNGPVARLQLLKLCEQMDLLSVWEGNDERYQGSSCEAADHRYLELPK